MKLRVFLIILTVAVLVAGPDADAAQPGVRHGADLVVSGNQPGAPLAFAPWVRAADLTATARKTAVNPASPGVRPAVLVETNYPAYDPAFNLGDGMSVYLERRCQRLLDAGDHGSLLAGPGDR